MKLLRLLLSAVVALGAPAAAMPQDRPSVEGRVVNSLTGEPVRRAMVTLSHGDDDALEVETDSAGRFTFAGPMPPGGYSITVERNGFRRYPPQHRPGDGLILLTPGERKTGLTIRLAPCAVITGRILDEQGDPIPEIPVKAVQWMYNPHGRLLVPIAHAMTNDLGEYRLHGLPPGRYYVHAEPPSDISFGRSSGAKRVRYLAAYYPGPPDAASASPLTVRTGQLLTGLDIVLRRGSFGTLTGRMAFPSGATGVSISVRAESAGGTTSSGTSPDADGTFVIPYLEPGTYSISGQYQLGEKKFAALANVQMGTVDSVVDLRPIPQFDITGRVRVDGPFSGRLSAIKLQLEHGTAHSTTEASDTGTFAFRSLGPDVYRIQVPAVSLGGKLYLQSVRLGSADVTDTGIDASNGPPEGDLWVLLSANGGQIEGTLEDDGASPLSLPVVTLVSDASTSEYRRRTGFQVATAVKGKFSFGGIAPGKYRLYAWREVDTNVLRYYPDFAKRFDALSQTVDVSDGTKENVTLKVIEVTEEE